MTVLDTRTQSVACVREEGLVKEEQVSRVHILAWISCRSWKLQRTPSFAYMYGRWLHQVRADGNVKYVNNSHR